MKYLQYFIGDWHNYGISGQQVCVITIAVYIPKLNNRVLQMISSKIWRNDPIKSLHAENSIPKNVAGTSASS